MAVLNLRVDDAIRAELEQFAEIRGMTVSALLREQIDVALGRGVRMRRDDVPQSVPMFERLLLARQARTLARLIDDDYETQLYLRDAEILEEGFTGEYNTVFGSIQPELGRTDCALLWDILDMFRILKASIDALSPEDRGLLGDEAAEDLLFDGFDLADSLEGRMLTYLRFLIRTDRWTELKDRLAVIGDNGHSHHATLPSYQRKLGVFTPIMKQRYADRGYRLEAMQLSVDELRAVAAA